MWAHLGHWARGTVASPSQFQCWVFIWCILSISMKRFVCATLEPTYLLINGKCRPVARKSPPAHPFIFFLPNQLFYYCLHWYVIGIPTRISCKSHFSHKFFYVCMDYVDLFLNGIAKILKYCGWVYHIVNSKTAIKETQILEKNKKKAK